MAKLPVRHAARDRLARSGPPRELLYMALNPRHIEDFVKRLQAQLPGGVEGAEAVREDFRANVREALSALLARMELVTREEFEVQAALLDRAYGRLETLEAKLAALESVGARATGDPARPDREP